MDCSLPCSAVPGILQARIMEWVAMPFSRGASWPRDRTHVSYISCIGRHVLYHECHLGSLGIRGLCFILNSQDYREFKSRWRVCVCVHPLVKSEPLKVFYFFFSFWHLHEVSSVLLQGEAGFQWEWKRNLPLKWEDLTLGLGPWKWIGKFDQTGSGTVT